EEQGRHHWVVVRQGCSRRTEKRRPPGYPSPCELAARDSTVPRWHLSTGAGRSRFQHRTSADRSSLAVLWQSSAKRQPRSGLRPATVSSSMSLVRSEEHTSELQSRENLVCRLLL